MKVITIAALKGGVGKSTLAACFAIEASKRGERVALIDRDPQQSLANWWHRWAANTPDGDDNPAMYEQADDIDEVIALVLKAGHTLAIIEAPPRQIDEIEPTISVADFVLIPVLPSPLDVEAVEPVAQLAEEMSKPFAFVINKGSHGAKTLTAGARTYLEKQGPVLKAFTTDRKAYVAAMGAKGETGPDRDEIAAEEIKSLWTEICGLLAPKRKKVRA